MHLPVDSYMVPAELFASRSEQGQMDRQQVEFALNWSEEQKFAAEQVVDDIENDIWLLDCEDSEEWREVMKEVLTLNRQIVETMTRHIGIYENWISFEETRREDDLRDFGEEI